VQIVVDEMHRVCNTHASEVHRKLDKKILKDEITRKTQTGEGGKHRIKIKLEERGYDDSELD
jgi:hypothetical protein